MIFLYSRADVNANAKWVSSLLDFFVVLVYFLICAWKLPIGFLLWYCLIRTLLLLSSAPRATSEQQQLSPAVAQFSAVGEALAPMCKSRLLDARFYELHSCKLLQFDDLMTISQQEIERYLLCCYSERASAFLVQLIHQAHSLVASVTMIDASCHHFDALWAQIRELDFP